MPNFTYDGRLKNLPDIQKNYMFELYIPSLEELNQDDMLLRVRNVILPGRAIQPIESFFMGSRAFYPGRTEYTGTFTCQFEEMEDQKVHTAINSWQQYIYNYNPAAADGGQSAGAVKADMTRDIVLKMYKSNGEKMENDIVYYNAWPQNIADVTLDYTGNESVKYDVTWQFDYWLVRK